MYVCIYIYVFQFNFPLFFLLGNPSNFTVGSVGMMGFLAEFSARKGAKNAFQCISSIPYFIWTIIFAGFSRFPGYSSYSMPPRLTHKNVNFAPVNQSLNAWLTRLHVQVRPAGLHEGYPSMLCPIMRDIPNCKFTEENDDWLVVWNMFYFSIYWE